MKEKDKNIKTDLSDFVRYSEEKMTDRERNSFERELQKDPFAEEADEGFDEISPEEAASDIHHLNKQLKTRISHRPGMVYFRIAASVAVLMILSSVYIVLERNKSSGELSDISAPKAQMEIIETEKVKGPVPKDEVPVAKKKTDQKAELQTKEVLSKTASREKVKSEAAKKEEIIPVEEKEVDYYKVEDKMAAPAAAMIKQEPVQAVLDDSLIVAGYVIAERAKTDAAAGKAAFDQSSYLPPQPVDGKESFDKYIEENIRKPETLSRGEKAIVVISFLVKNTGAIDSVKVIRSPGNEFSEEAKRLIIDGPKWKPAESNRIKIDDQVRLRIIFK